MAPITSTSQPGRQKQKMLFAAHGIHRQGGMERAAYEVLSRLTARWDIVILAHHNEVPGVCFHPVRCIRRPGVLASIAFRRAVRQRMAATDAITVSIGAAAGPVDVVIGQFCHAAFTSLYGGLRGGPGIGGLWQRYCQQRFVADERAVYNDPRLKRVIAVSVGVGNEIIKHYGVSPDKVVVIPNAADREVFRPTDPATKKVLRRDLKLPELGIIAAFVGGDWRRKGLADAIAALAIATDVHLVVVGKGDISFWEEQAKQVGVASRVHFAGSSSTPQEYLQACDLYVFPSRYEAFSLSCIEAAATGLPLIVTKINGMEEFVVDGENGFFVEADPRDIGRRLTQLRDDPVLLRSMQQRARDSTAQYTWDEIARRHEMVFEEVAVARLAL